MFDEQTTKGGAERVLFVLATLARLERSVSISALVAETGLAQSTLYRQLALLKRWGFVVDNNSEFMPGPMCVPLAWGFDRSSYLTQEAHSELEQLSRSSGESIGLLMAFNNQAVCLDMVESRQPLRCSFVKGRILPLCKGASAKALLAFMEKERRAAVFRYLVREKILSVEDIEQLEIELRAIVGRGFSTTDSEVDEGVWGVSAPVYQQGGNAVAVITLMAPNTRTRNRERFFIDMTVTVASRISSRLQSL
ncbi:IclR family transcriptional regulator [Allopusillimonas ginsengisoli]|uniref:IclR family transcriptional regulator n=1 Tax=Allopusillimonas ginsengisoli TaxID=453575 RepID=UPI0010C199EC|nr:IclR family transcriptional regulator [Allopusillimonas ginsengisoli]